MFHFIYETTCLVNCKKYRGKHSTNDLNDGYLGSGKNLVNDIKKYDKRYFYRRILKFFKNRKELDCAEGEYVDHNWIYRSDTYNTTTGTKNTTGERIIEGKQKSSDIDRIPVVRIPVLRCPVVEDVTDPKLKRIVKIICKKVCKKIEKRIRISGLRSEWTKELDLLWGKHNKHRSSLGGDKIPLYRS